MQNMTWRDGRLRPETGKGFITRILLAHLQGQSKEEFAKAELRRMACPFCAEGWPREGDQHVLQGIITPCEATTERSARDA